MSSTPLKFQIIADGAKLPQIIPTYELACECIAALRAKHPGVVFVVNSIHDRAGLINRIKETHKQGSEE